VERILAVYRSTSSSVAVVALVVANLVPLVGVLAFGWELLTILAIYWLENGVVGVFNVLRMASARGARGASGLSEAAAKVTMIPFFCVHYGIFWVVHGVFVFTLPAFAGPVAKETAFGEWVDAGTLAGAVLALTISHGVSYWMNFLRGGEYRRVSAADLMMAPYGRVVVLHLTILFGGIAVAVTGASVAALVLLVVLKTILDLRFHLGEHSRLRAAPSGDETDETR
jgi:hypothetical protein